MRGNRDGTAQPGRRAPAARGPRGSCWFPRWPPGGPADRGSPLTGTEPPRPVTAYGRSKLAAEAAVTAGALPWVIVRPPTVYGPRDREVLKVFRMARLGRRPRVRRRQPAALRRCTAPTWRARWSRPGRRPPRSGRSTTLAIPRSSTSAEFVRAVGNGDGPPAPVWSRFPRAVGRALLARDRGRRPAHRARPTILTRDKANEFFQAARGSATPARSPGTRAGARPTIWCRALADTYRWYRSAGWL